MGNALTRLLAYVLVLLSLPLTAQKRGYLPGYLITLEGDTIRGWVKDRSPEPFTVLYSRIRFRPEGRGRRGKYRARQLKGYAAGDRVYQSVRLREETDFFRFRYYKDPAADAIFLRVVRKEGRLTWYEREFMYDDNNYVDSYPLFHRAGSAEMVRVTQGILGLKKERLRAYFRECPPLLEALDKKEVTTVRQLFSFLLDSCAYQDRTRR